MTGTHWIRIRKTLFEPFVIQHSVQEVLPGTVRARESCDTPLGQGIEELAQQILKVVRESFVLMVVALSPVERLLDAHVRRVFTVNRLEGESSRHHYIGNVAHREEVRRRAMLLTFRAQLRCSVEVGDGIWIEQCGVAFGHGTG